MKYIIDFQTIESANTAGQEGLDSPHIDLVEETGATNAANPSGDKFKCTFDSEGNMVNPRGLHTITLVAGTGGTVSGEGTYTDGTQVTITATPDEGYKLSSWSDGVTSSTRVITVSSDITLTATFTDQFTVELLGDNGTFTGAGTYTYNTQVTITATPNTGYSFTKWSDDVTDATRTVTVTSDISLTATFTATSQQNT